MSKEQDLVVLRRELREQLVAYRDHLFLYQMLSDLEDNMPRVEFPGTRYTQLDDELIDVLIKHLEVK